MPKGIVLFELEIGEGRSAPQIPPELDGGQLQKTPKTKDVWNVEVSDSEGPKWSEMTPLERVLAVTLNISKLALVIGLLYMFIVALGIMGDSFQVLAGPTAGQVFRNRDIFENPIAGLVLGVLATVLVQSSSTSTSVIISMTASNLLKVESAVPMIMGANIGTSVTNTIVSMFHLGNKDEYQRAFAGATVHDCFNILTVIILLPLEAATHLLQEVAEWIVGDKAYSGEEDTDLLKELTDALRMRIVDVDKEVVTKVAEAKTQEELDKYLDASMIDSDRDTGNHIFMDTPLSDDMAGWIMLIASLLMLCNCLILIVKISQSVFRGRVAVYMKYLLNLEFRNVPFLADYVLILFGVGITILMQSSSVTTSTLTPLVGIGLVRLEKMFCFTVGANIGTTVTGILSALSSDDIRVGLIVALAHLLFNVIGTLIWFPVPIIRAVPIGMAKYLGRFAARHRWFPFAYIVVMFGFLPGILLLLSLAHWSASLLVFVALIGSAISFMVLKHFKPGIVDAATARGRSLMEALGIHRCLGGTSDNDRNSNGPLECSEDATEALEPDGKSHINVEPLIWGPAWFIFCSLLLVCFNAKWADIKYDKHDSRNHVGFGAWAVCGKDFEQDAFWAKPPVSMDECAEYYPECAADFLSRCNASGFADGPDGEPSREYWAVMEACTDKCSLRDWELFCRASPCQGSQHHKHCMNVANKADWEYDLEYQITANDTNTGAGPWRKGERCRSIDLLCDNEALIMQRSGNFGAAGLVILAVGQACFILRGLVPKLAPETWNLAGFCMFCISWLLLLAAWAVFTDAAQSLTACKVQVPGNHGYAIARGDFIEIINTGGGYTYYVVWASWLTLAPLLCLFAFKVFSDCN